MNINDICQHRSQGPRLTEFDRFTFARLFYNFLCEQQNLPEEQREWADVDGGIRIVLALFPELFLLRDQVAPRAPADDNVFYLR
jgi:hypothetical protein